MSIFNLKYNFRVTIALLLGSKALIGQVISYEKVNIDKKGDTLYLQSLVNLGYKNLRNLKDEPNSKQKDSSVIATNYFLARVYQNWSGKTDSLKKYADKTVSISKNNLEYLIKGKIAQEFYFQIKKGDFQKALSLNFEILRTIAQNKDYQSFTSKINYNIGSIYLQMGEHSKAEQYFLTAKNTFISPYYTADFYAVILQKLGNTNQFNGDLTSAEKNYKIAISVLKDDSSELIKAYILQDLGNLNVKQKKYTEALENFAKGTEIFKKLKKTKSIVELNADMLDVYYNQGDYEKVINIGEEVLKNSQTRPVWIKTLEKLENIYEQKKNYELAFKKMKFRKWLEDINKKEETKKAISKIQAEYDLQLKDSKNYTELQKQTVLNQRILAENEILRLKTELENQMFSQKTRERELKTKFERDSIKSEISGIKIKEQLALNSLRFEKLNQKIELEKRTEKYILLTLASLLFFSAAIYWYRKQQARQRVSHERITSKLEQQLAETEISALRSQMNPHFIFNCLNSIKLYSLENDSESASIYLTKFSKLIRLVLENSRSERLTLEKEIETLRLYIEMEIMRFKEKVQYEMVVSPEIDQQYVEIPPLLIQPFVENAIWHGLMHKEFGGKVSIMVNLIQEIMLEIQIIDNGVGRKKSAEYKSKTATNHKSFGMKVTNERIDLINQIYKTKAKVEIVDLYDEKQTGIGTKVIIQIPI